MTDGGIYFSERGEELKEFNIQDGYGLVQLQRQGVKVGILTGRVSGIVRRRAAELGISEVHQNLENKVEVYSEIKARLGLRDGEIAYIGDDDPDLPVLTKVGFSAAPRDAVETVRKAVHYVCKKNGGHGAVREVVDLILRSRGNG